MARSFSDDGIEGDAATGRNAQLIPPARFMADLADTVRIFCKVRRAMSIIELAHKAGITENRMVKLLHSDPLERRQASGSELLSIWAVLGAAGASYGLASIGMTAEDSDTSGDPDRLGLAVADLFDAGADLARAAVNGVIEPGEAETTLLACDRAEAEIKTLRQAARKARKRR